MHWNAWNITHIGREGYHTIPQEVEYITFSNRTVIQRAKNGRFMFLGPTKDARMLVAILESEGDGVWYCVSARSASRKERELYRREITRRRHL